MSIETKVGTPAPAPAPAPVQAPAIELHWTWFAWRATEVDANEYVHQHNNDSWHVNMGRTFRYVPNAAHGGFDIQVANKR